MAREVTAEGSSQEIPCDIPSQLSVEDGLLIRGSRIVIPSYLRQDMLHRIHECHQGFVKCRERARHSVWWPGLSAQLEDLVYNLSVGVPQSSIMPMAEVGDRLV